MQRIDHRCVLYVAFNAINQKSDPLLIVEILNVIYRLCEGLALKNWYDYDLCLGRRQEELCHDRACLCALSSGEHLYSGWYCGIRTTLAKATQKPTSDLREWTWLNTEINQAGCFGQIDFFYWNFLFLRKRFCLYKNPFNAVKFNAKTFIETHSLRDMQGNMLDLCFDCWNFTSNLGEIVCIFNDDKKTSDKKKNVKCGAPFFLGAINFIINNREGESVTKPNMGLVDDYAHNVVESLLLRINEEFFTSSDLKVGTHIRLDSVFRRNERKELKSTTSVALHIAAECWLSLRASVRTIETIKIRQSMQSHVMTTDFGRRLVRCIEQLVSSSKLLFFGGLSHFNFTCVLAINQQLHLCMLLQNGERLMASPVAPLYAGLDDTISPRLYMKFSNMSSAKDSPATEPNARLFISAFDEKRQRSLSDKTVVEKYIHQPVCVKSSIKKKKFSKLFSVNKVDYIAFDTDRKSAFAGFYRDRLVKRIHIEEDSAIDAVVRLTLEDPVGNVNEQSQLEILLDEIEVATLRKKSVQSQPPFEFGFLSSPPAERKKNSIGSYAIPVSKKNVFNDKVPVIDEYARSLRQNKCDEASMLTREKIIPTNYPVHVKMPMNNKVNNEEAGIEKMQITANRRLISHLDSLYATLRYIIGLVSMEEKIPNSNADNGAIVGQCCMNKKKIDATYAYFMQNRGNVHCQKTILENTIDLLDDVSRISMELISQKKYNTYEKVRQLLMGSLCATDNQLQFCG